MSRFRHGLVLGKFYPLHAGHDHLIRTAVRACAEVTVEVLAASVESIPLSDRLGWVREQHPTVRAVGAVDDAPVDYGSAAAWDEHMTVITGLLSGPVDAVFTSDSYGAELARRLDAQWVRVDPGRRLNPVSGTAVRGDLAAGWADLGPAVRASLARRVVVLGAESTGTTTLAEDLAAHYGTVAVPEYGRLHSVERAPGPWRSDEFELIADRQQADERRAARTGPTPLVICDTDVLATAVWHERYVGRPAPGLLRRAAAHRPILYVHTGDEIPFVQDGTRDGEHVRGAMADRFRTLLGAGDVPWLEVRGSRADRLASVIAAVDAALPRAFAIADPLPQAGGDGESGAR